MGFIASLTKGVSPKNSGKLVSKGTFSHSHKANLWCPKDDAPFQQTSDDFKESSKLITTKKT